jgi:hypothetical protein
MVWLYEAHEAVHERGGLIHVWYTAPGGEIQVACGCDKTATAAPLAAVGYRRCRRCFPPAQGTGDMVVIEIAASGTAKG